MVLTMVCDECKQGRHDRCSGDKPPTTQVSCICICEVCGKRHAEKARDFSRAATRALYGTEHYDAAIADCVRELDVIALDQWNSQILRDILQKHFGQYSETAARDVINKVAKMKGVHFRIPFNSDSLPARYSDEMS